MKEGRLKLMGSVDLQQPKNQGQYLWRWRDLLIILIGTGFLLVAGAVVFLVIFIAVGNNLEDLLKPTATETLGLTALEALALIGGVYFFGLRRKGLQWEAVGLRSTSTRWYVISVVVTLMVIPIASLVVLLWFLLIGQPFENPQLDFLLPEGLSAFDALLMLFLAGFAAPFGEELLFRGVLYTMFRERWAIWLSVIISSFLFGLIHGNVAVGLTGFLVGIIAALVYEYSKSLWTAILVHSINNSLKIGLLYLLVELGLNV
jgi:membrane protease YdiL (CAAX protease family)